MKRDPVGLCGSEPRASGIHKEGHRHLVREFDREFPEPCCQRLNRGGSRPSAVVGMLGKYY